MQIIDSNLTLNRAKKTLSLKVLALGAGALICLPLLGAQTASAASGGLDATFGRNGKVKTDFNGNNDLAYGMALQADGKVIVAGISFAGNDASGGDFAVARYNANGMLDTSFGVGGKVTTDMGQTENASSVVVQPDGKIIVGGGTYPIFPSSGGQFALVRYNSNGSLDTSFGDDGIVQTTFSTSGCYASALALQTDGKIVAAGTNYRDFSSNSDFGLVRYNSNGTLDTSFGTNGLVSTEFDGMLDAASSVLIQSDGKIVAVGSASSSATFYDFAVVRYLANGQIDTSFGTAGKVRTDFGGANLDIAYAGALQADGKIIAAGVTTDRSGSKTPFALARYNSNGTLDTSFSSDGRTSVDFGGYFQAVYQVLVQPDGKIVAAGYPNSEGSDSDFLLTRLNSNGSIDTTFGAAGKVRTSFGDLNGGANAAVLQPDGKIVAAGFQATSTQKATEIVMARYLP